MVDRPDFLDAEHQHFPRPALGPRPGDLRRRPYLTGAIAVEFIQGLQGDDPNYMLAMALRQALRGPQRAGSRSPSLRCRPSDRDLYETYLPQFERAVREGHVAGVMGAYSALNGVPDCANTFLLTDLLRKQWGFEGYVVSDCDAISDIWRPQQHHYVNTPEEAAALAVKAGCNLCCGDHNVAWCLCTSTGSVGLANESPIGFVNPSMGASIKLSVAVSRGGRVLIYL